jgi:hypothetical protein
MTSWPMIWRRAETFQRHYLHHEMTNSARSYEDSQSGSFGEFCLPNLLFCRNTEGFWRLSTTRATLIAIFCSISSIFDVPVYWPILVMYFFVLFFLTMRRQIQSVSTHPVFPVISSLTSAPPLQTHDQVQIRSLRYWQENTLRITGDTAFSLVWSRAVPHRSSPVTYISPVMRFFLSFTANRNGTDRACRNPYASRFS